MAARRIGQYIPDWAKLSSRLRAGDKVHMGQMRSSYETLKTNLDSISAKPEPIDWEFYAKNISKPGLVSSFQKSFEAITVPFPKDNQSQEIAKIEKHMEERSKELKKESLERIKECEAELAKIRAQKPFEEQTVEDILKENPELGKQAEEEIKQNNWL